MEVSTLKEALMEEKIERAHTPHHCGDGTHEEVAAEEGCHGGMERAQHVSQQVQQCERFSVDDHRPCVLITNDDGIRAPGLRALARALVNSSCCQVFVCAPDSNKSAASHSITVHDTLEVRSFEIEGAIAYEVSGTPVDCVSLSLCGVLFPPMKPSLVLSGINKGSNCGYHVFYSGTVAGAREALICGVPAISLSLDWKIGESLVTDFEVAASICLPLIKTALRDLDRGVLSNSFFLSIEIPISPSKHKGFKVTRQGPARLPINWRAVSPQGAVRKVDSPSQNTEIESITGPENGSELLKCEEKQYFGIHYTEGKIPNMDTAYDFGAVQEGYVAVTPLGLGSQHEEGLLSWAADWISTSIASL